MIFYSNLPLKDPSNIPDPYVKLYLLPDRAKDTKRKTQVSKLFAFRDNFFYRNHLQTIKDNCDPTYDESFEYTMSQPELENQHLEVTICTQKQLFYSNSNIMGQVFVEKIKQPKNKHKTFALP